MSYDVPASSIPPRVPRPRHPVTTVSPQLERLAGAAVRTPVVEPDPGGDGVLITFLWRERRPTREVLVLANKLADRADLSRSRMSKLAGTDLWHLTYRLRSDWQASYVLAPDEGDGRFEVADPLNPRSFLGKSVAAGPDAAAAPRWWEPQPGVPAGLTDDVLVRGRRVWRYRPPGHRGDGGPYPLLVMLDGDVWGPVLPIAPILDNLIAAGRIPPVVALLPDSVDRPTRFTEYACDPAHARFLRTVIGVAGDGLAATTDPARTVVAGQSLGGLAAAFAALSDPGRFGNVLTQSGSFWWPSGSPDDAEAERFAREVARAPRHRIRWHVEAGLDEWVSLGPNRHLRDVLVAKGYELTYAEFAGGHDRLCWRARLGDALTSVFHRLRSEESSSVVATTPQRDDT